VLHLDHDLGPVVQPRDVRLGDGRGRERREVEGGERLLHRAAQVRRQRRPHRRLVVGRHVGLELAQVGGHVRSDEVDPRAEHLAELDERRPELDERLAEPLAVAQRVAAQAHPGRHELAQVRMVRERDHVGDAVVREHPQHLLDAAAVLDERADGGMRRGHGRDPTWRARPTSVN
jgi:hypothetical protein